MLRTPLNFKKWIDDNRHLFKPPVGNKMVWQDGEFIVMVVGSNFRRDYHVNEGEEFFHQIEGDMTLKVVDDGKVVDIPIREGEIFLLQPRVPHSPRRPDGTIGLVVEKRRTPGQLDGFQWHCENCGRKLHEEFEHISDIVKQLPPLFAKFYGDESKRMCGVRHALPGPGEIIN